MAPDATHSTRRTAKFVDQPRIEIVTDLGSAALVIEHVAGRRVTVAGGQADVAAPDLAELGRPRLEQRPFQLGELLVARDLQVQVDAPDLAVHVPILTPPDRAAGTLPA